MSVALDHLIVAAHSLAQGAVWCQQTLGVLPAPGGKHPQMGTHNQVVRLGGAAYPDTYLEIIAIDPDAPDPGRPRWFGLDDAALQQRLLAHGPRLIHAVARSTMLDMHRWGLITVGQRPGNPMAFSRQAAQGLLSWEMLLRDDGGLDCGGALPTLIQWKSAHPAPALPDSGVTLQSLTLHGVPARARDVLRLRGVQVLAEAGAALHAVLTTPRGEVHLTSDPT